MIKKTYKKMLKNNQKFSLKFYIGLTLVILSFILGKITNLTLLFYFDNHLLRWTSIIIYIISWPMLFIGGWWIGKEYYDKIQKYMNYKYYHESLKKGTKKALHHTKNMGSKISRRIIKK